MMLFLFKDYCVYVAGWSRWIMTLVSLGPVIVGMVERQMNKNLVAQNLNRKFQFELIIILHVKNIQIICCLYSSFIHCKDYETNTNSVTMSTKSNAFLMTERNWCPLGKCLNAGLLQDIFKKSRNILWHQEAEIQHYGGTLKRFKANLKRFP